MSNPLSEAIRSASALRSSARLLPTIPGGRVMPPTFPRSDEDQDSREGSTYLFETRVTPDGTKSDAVVLDTVGSSANRLEAALLEAVREGAPTLPDIVLDVGEFGELSTLELPHRCFDAYLREGLLNGTPFPQSEVGQALAAATPRNATALYRHAPASLLLGVWDSHGDRGGLGSRFARALSSELVGFGVEKGRRSAQRTDPLIQKQDEIAIYESKNDGESFTLNQDDAKSSGKKAKQIRMSELGFGSVPATQMGGVTIEHAEQQVVISLGQLRRLRFPIDGEDNEQRNRAGRAVLAALGLLAVELHRDTGFSLRSGCELSLETEPAWERVGRTLDSVEPLEVGGSAGALELFESAVDRAEEHGLRFAETVHLVARPEMVKLVKAARAAK